MEPEIKMDFQLSPCSYIGVIINTSLALGTRFISAIHYTEAKQLIKSTRHIPRTPKNRIKHQGYIKFEIL